MTDRISLVASEQSIANLSFVLKVYLRQCTCQVRGLVSSWFNGGVKTLLLLNIRALVEFCHVPSLPVTITTTHCYSVVL